MYSLTRPLLFCINPENAHHAGLALLGMAHSLHLDSMIFPKVPDLPCEIMGLKLKNPVGLAAGMDKNGAYINALASMGFGYIEVGTVTPRAQAGNPKPRLFRLPEHQAIINRMGFNNLGVDALIENVKKAKYQGTLGINIGKNADTPIENAVDDYLICLEKAYAYADYFVINISSPNTKNLRALQGQDELSTLLASLKEAQAKLAQQHGRYVPMAVKIAPDLTDEEVEQVAQVFLEMQIDGMIATNTTLNKLEVAMHQYGQEQGGLSGLPVKKQSNHVLRLFAEHLQNRLPIIGVGGILSGEDACEKMKLGASAVQIYSGLIYAGPKLIGNCVKQIANMKN